jgi:hypothetical protein
LVFAIVVHGRRLWGPRRMGCDGVTGVAQIQQVRCEAWVAGTFSSSPSADSSSPYLGE